MLQTNQISKILNTYGAAILIVVYYDGTTISISRNEKCEDHCKVKAHLFVNRDQGIERIVLQEFGVSLKERPLRPPKKTRTQTPPLPPHIF